MRLYYMTSAKWGEVILKERRLKLSRFSESNDPFELMLIDIRPLETRKVVKMIADHYSKNVGMICFGSNWRSPVMWAHYADKHTGVCLGFDVADALLTKVKYTNKKINASFGEHLPSFGLSADLLTKLVSTKALDWKYENEYRVMGNLVVSDPANGMFYTDFGPQIQLREVVIGCRCGWTVDHVRGLVRNVVDPVRVCKARPAFGKFEMIEQGEFKPVILRPTEH
jgi:hypothetical protein